MTKEQIDSIFGLPMISSTINVITKEKPLSILNFNLVSENSNSTYLYTMNTIIQSRFKHQEGYGNENISVFTHELGHALHYNLTHDKFIFPDNFEALFEFTSNRKWDVVKIDDHPEIFADLFTAVALYGTIYEDRSNIIKILSKEIIEIIKKYYNHIINET